MDFDKAIDKTVDKIFSLKKSTLYLFLIFALAFVLRLIAAINLSVAADDMHFVAHAVNFFSAGGLVTYDQSSGLWFAFTGIIYDLFGMSQVTSRAAALIFGSLSIFAIYLLSKEFFNEKVSLIAAFLLAVSPFHIKSTMAEMDVMAMFFVLFGMLFFVRALKDDKYKMFAISGLFIGLAVYTKVYPLLFIPSLLLYFVYYKWKSKTGIITKNNIKKLLVFLVFIFVFTVPALTHNYLLYKDKGFLDLQFTRTLGLGKNISEQYYGWDHQFNAKNDWKGLIFGNSSNSGSISPTLFTSLGFVINLSPVFSILALIGILIMLIWSREKRDYLVFFLFSISFILPFLASIILLSKHFIFLEIFSIPIGALAISKVNNGANKILKKDATMIILILVLLSSLFILGMPNKGISHFYGKSAIGQVIDFRNSRITDNSLIVADSRIYRGRIHWMSLGRPYLEGTQFISVLNNQDQLPGNIVLVDVYYFECVIDDCGWGTVKNQPEFNSSMESLTKEFSDLGRLEEKISEPDRDKSYFPFVSEENKIETIRIYHLSIPMKESMLAFASQPKEWFLYPIGYGNKESIFDSYTVHSVMDRILDKTAHWIVLLALVFAFLSPFYLLCLIIIR